MSDAYTKVYRHCLAILRDPGDAQDAVQEVFTRAAAAGRDGAALDWLMGVADHVCMDEFRRRTRVRETVERVIAAGLADPNPESLVVARLLLSQLRPHLSDAETRVLLHRLATGATLEQTAAALGLAGSTVRNLAMRMRQKLRPLLPQVGAVPAWRQVMRWLRRARSSRSQTGWAARLASPVAITAIVLALSQAGVFEPRPPESARIPSGVPPRIVDAVAIAPDAGVASIPPRPQPEAGGSSQRSGHGGNTGGGGVLGGGSNHQVPSFNCYAVICPSSLPSPVGDTGSQVLSALPPGHLPIVSLPVSP